MCLFFIYHHEESLPIVYTWHILCTNEGSILSFPSKAVNGDINIGRSFSTHIGKEVLMSVNSALSICACHFNICFLCWVHMPIDMPHMITIFIGDVT